VELDEALALAPDEARPLARGEELRFQLFCQDHFGQPRGFVLVEFPKKTLLRMKI